MVNKQPMVSCLCITYKKPHLITRAIQCFRNQTYQARELVILYQDDDLETKALLNTLNDANILVIEVKETEKLSLGAKRNLSIETCKGDYFCTWDDDDWYHRERIESQISSLKGSFKPVSVLIHVLLYDSIEHQAYMSLAWPWENTVLCDKSLFKKFRYHPEWNKKEDSYFLNDLLKANAIYPLVKPSLYIYTYNGNNICGYNHFQNLFANSQLLPLQTSRIVRSVLEGEYSSQQGSALLLGEDVLKQIDYLGWAKSLMQSNVDSTAV
jgi:glycosyltransferase involved in cell wall biosynthesis